MANVITGMLEGSASGGGGSSFIGLLFIFAAVFLVGFTLILAIFIIIWYTSYKHRVIIFEKTAEGKRFKVTRAKKVVREGVTKYRFLMKKTMVQPPPGWRAKYFFGKNEALVLHKENDAFYFHIDYKVNENELEVLPQEGIDFVVNEIKSNMQRYGQLQFWDRYGGAVVNIMFTILVFMLFLFLAKRFNDVAGALSSTANGLKDAVQQVCTTGVVPV